MNLVDLCDKKWKSIRIDAQKAKLPRKCDECGIQCLIWYIRRDSNGAAEVIIERTSGGKKRVTGFKRRKIYCEACTVLLEVIS
jgi:hypothetical protein